jgi:hypothetical protein
MTNLHSSCLAGQTYFSRLGVTLQSGLVDHKQGAIVRLGGLPKYYR